MKKVGIMSMQRIINYGSFLQAYALSHIIKNLGNEVEFVDFKIEPCLFEPYTPETADSFSGKDKFYFQEVEKFNDKFKNEYLPELEIHERNERPKLDTLVIGSDEVFNCLQNNADVGYSLELFGKDHNANKVITYAASCGSTTYERLLEHEKHEEISELLNKINHISVRDANSKKVVESLSNIVPVSHLDPVLVYDFSNDVIDNVNIENYIIVYAYSFNLNDEECNYIKKFAKKHNKKIVSLGTYQRCADIYIPAHPLEVLPYFKKADYIITNTFHGTIFAIKTNKPFVSFIRNYNSQKMTDLLEKLNLSNRIITSLAELDTKFEENIDFTITNKIIEEEKNKSIEYLKECI